jgi:hypothetical protein
MACCGKNRKKKARRAVVAIYTGFDPEYSFHGVFSGKNYRFFGNGFRNEIERRDWNSRSGKEPMEEVKNNH